MLTAEQRAKLSEAADWLNHAEICLGSAMEGVPVTGDPELHCLRIDVQRLRSSARLLQEHARELAGEGTELVTVDGGTPPDLREGASM